MQIGKIPQIHKLLGMFCKLLTVGQLSVGSAQGKPLGRLLFVFRLQERFQVLATGIFFLLKAFFIFLHLDTSMHCHLKHLAIDPFISSLHSACLACTKCMMRQIEDLNNLWYCSECVSHMVQCVGKKVAAYTLEITLCHDLECIFFPHVNIWLSPGQRSGPDFVRSVSANFRRAATWC